eukprot:scaffold10755_cov123-Skeletonema_dohrnii-CCMP3373.AAC.2
MTSDASTRESWKGLLISRHTERYEQAQLLHRSRSQINAFTVMQPTLHSSLSLSEEVWESGGASRLQLVHRRATW